MGIIIEVVKRYTQMSDDNTELIARTIDDWREMQKIYSEASAEYSKLVDKFKRINPTPDEALILFYEKRKYSQLSVEFHQKRLEYAAIMRSVGRNTKADNKSVIRETRQVAYERNTEQQLADAEAALRAFMSDEEEINKIMNMKRKQLGIPEVKSLEQQMSEISSLSPEQMEEALKEDTNET
jgi:hypothetical protein